MNSPWTDADGATLTAVILGVLLVYVLAFEPRLGVRFFEGFRQASTTEASRRPRWFAALIGMQVAAIAVVVLLVALLPEVTPASIGILWPVFESDFALGLLAGASGGLLAGLVLTVLAARRQAEMPVIGDVAVLLPRSTGERGWLVGISVGAGISEELLYRGLLPALAVGLGAPVLPVVIGQAAIFGFAHVYQGWSGVALTGLLGLIFGVLVVLTGSLLLPILLHILIDIRIALAPRAAEPAIEGSAPA